VHVHFEVSLAVPDQLARELDAIGPSLVLHHPRQQLLERSPRRRGGLRWADMLNNASCKIKKKPSKTKDSDWPASRTTNAPQWGPVHTVSEPSDILRRVESASLVSPMLQ
jgi:hypothetical protein